jgi:hypothetical protein
MGQSDAVEDEDAVRSRQRKKRDTLDNFRAAWELEFRGSGRSRAEVTLYMAQQGFPLWDTSKISKFLKGKVGASLDECVALAGAIQTSLDDLLSIDSTPEALYLRADREWAKMTRTLEEIDASLFSLYAARRDYLRTLSRLRAKKMPMPKHRGFAEWWNLLDLYLNHRTLASSLRKGKLPVAYQKQESSFLAALAREPDEQKRLAMVESKLNVFADVSRAQIALIHRDAEERTRLEETAREGILMDKLAAIKRLDGLQSRDLIHTLKALSEAEFSEPGVRANAEPPAE